ncbi:hypothetical protein [Roseivirga pacifica]|jgi:hypothetical protein|uniref:hypothetical protein n=1 Tax=Roseivirga pacifica TaxID=1267423 RepID=UPI0020941004|nr:hypothetical protein [Roseivirga pacifica]MCO6359639.1 hypothetical protein [Roseivirga pacifica]MCO6367009.1 hypothetical protein [Roseivirga pacifica]MCO6370459.1 hypothetical protein [Roseivirga pacifica]MCO6374666.1 hypothetical protein [Roseivirga pacifica]MCO6379924.1 hypothetical protein [Roseivirga pacifica]
MVDFITSTSLVSYINKSESQVLFDGLGNRQKPKKMYSEQRLAYSLIMKDKYGFSLMVEFYFIGMGLFHKLEILRMPYEQW